MRKTLTQLLFAASLPLLAGTVLAAPMPERDGPMGGEMPMHERMGEHGGPRDGMPGMPGMRELDLTQEQRATLHDAMRDEMQARHQLVQRYLDKLPAADRAAMKKEEEAARLKRDKAIEAVLKPEQLTQYRKMRDEMDKRRAEREEFEAWKAERAKKAQ